MLTICGITLYSIASLRKTLICVSMVLMSFYKRVES